MKTCVLTVDMKEEKIIGLDFFHGDQCWRAAEAFADSIREDWPKPRYRVLRCRDPKAQAQFAKDVFNVEEAS